MHHFRFDTVKVLVTSYCNLNCKHCYQHFDKNRYQLSFGTLCQIVDFAVKNQTKVLDFGGGEFFEHPFAYQLLDYCYSRNIKVNVATNAVDLDLSYFQKYRDPQLVTIQISIDGKKDNHDKRRGEGNYEKTMENAKQLYDLGIKLSVSMALDEYNYHDAVEVLEVPYFEKYSLLPVVHVGAAKLTKGTSETSDYEETICYIMKNTAGEEDDFERQRFPHILAIKYDGGVYPSPVSADYGLFCFGNINENRIEDIVHEYCCTEEFKIITSVDSSQIAECNVCSAVKECSRGCRMRALKFHGSMTKPDPFYCRVFIGKYREIPLGKLFWGDKL